MGEMRDDSKRQDELGVADEPQAKEGGSAHTSFGIVEESVNTRVGELRRDLLYEEEVRVKPA